MMRRMMFSETACKWRIGFKDEDLAKLLEMLEK